MSFNQLTVTELKDLATKRGLKTSNLRKAEIVDLLTKEQSATTPVKRTTVNPPVLTDPVPSPLKVAPLNTSGSPAVPAPPNPARASATPLVGTEISSKPEGVSERDDLVEKPRGVAEEQRRSWKKLEVAANPDAEAEARRLRRELEEVKAKFEAEADRLKSVCKERDELAQKAESLASAQQEGSDLRAEIEKVRAQAEDEKGEGIKQAQRQDAEMQALQQKLEAVCRERDELALKVKSVTSAQQEGSDLRAEIETVRAQVEDEKGEGIKQAQRQDAEMKALQQKLEAVCRERDDLVQKVKSVTSEKDASAWELTRNVRAACAERDELARKLEEVSREKGKADTERDELVLKLEAAAAREKDRAEKELADRTTDHQERPEAGRPKLEKEQAECAKTPEASESKPVAATIAPVTDEPVSKQQVILAKLLASYASSQEASRFMLGKYRVVQERTAVGPGAQLGQGVLRELNAGVVVTVVEIQRLEEAGRIRGRIEQGGWISIIDMEARRVWAQPEALSPGSPQVDRAAGALRPRKRSASTIASRQEEDREVGEGEDADEDEKEGANSGKEAALATRGKRRLRLPKKKRRAQNNAEKKSDLEDTAQAPRQASRRQRRT